MAGCPVTTAYPFLLTIAVPTYNRASYLDLCLSQICPQLRPDNSTVELLVSNNCSTDGTDDIVRKFISLGHPITYLRNAENIGVDRNFAQCFSRANGKYVLILGDDDVILDGAVDKIVTILKSGDYGIVFLNSYGFTGDFARERTASVTSGYTVYDGTLQFVKRVAYFFTFTSANIVNRSLVEEPSDWGPFFDSNLVQLAWIFSALFNAPRNVYVSESLLAVRLYNSGGYALCRVFGHNFNKVFSIFIKKGIDRRYFRAINRKLLSTHFPAQITRLRNNLIRLEPEDYYRSLYPLYRGYLYFWLFTVPAIFLPARLTYLLFLVAEKLRGRKPATGKAPG
jgi:abequosyltransferase